VFAFLSGSLDHEIDAFDRYRLRILGEAMGGEAPGAQRGAQGDGGGRAAQQAAAINRETRCGRQTRRCLGAGGFRVGGIESHQDGRPAPGAPQGQHLAGRPHKACRLGLGREFGRHAAGRDGQHKRHLVCQLGSGKQRERGLRHQLS
jgi:hypothetical protein